jgi:hypothetical protein
MSEPDWTIPVVAMPPWAIPPATPAARPEAAALEPPLDAFADRKLYWETRRREDGQTEFVGGVSQRVLSDNVSTGLLTVDGEYGPHGIDLHGAVATYQNESEGMGGDIRIGDVDLAATTHWDGYTGFKLAAEADVVEVAFEARGMQVEVGWGVGGTAMAGIGDPDDDGEMDACLGTPLWVYGLQVDVSWCGKELYDLAEVLSPGGPWLTAYEDVNRARRQAREAQEAHDPAACPEADPAR